MKKIDKFMISALIVSVSATGLNLSLFPVNAEERVGANFISACDTFDIGVQRTLRKNLEEAPPDGVIFRDGNLLHASIGTAFVSLEIKDGDFEYLGVPAYEGDKVYPVSSSVPVPEPKKPSHLIEERKNESQADDGWNFERSYGGVAGNSEYSYSDGSAFETSSPQLTNQEKEKIKNQVNTEGRQPVIDVTKRLNYGSSEVLRNFKNSLKSHESEAKLDNLVNRSDLYIMNAALNGENLRIIASEGVNEYKVEITKNIEIKAEEKFFNVFSDLKK